MAAEHLDAPIALFGPALACHPGWVTTQGEVLAGLFAREGRDVRLSSTSIDPVRRAIDHVCDLTRWRREVGAVVVSVFSGRGFALADEVLSLSRLAGLPSVAWLHGGNLPAFGVSHPGWVRRVLRSADAVVAPSHYLQRWALEVTPNATVIPNVVELTSHPARHQGPVGPRLLWMRTFQELYDPPSAIRALAALRADGVPATLTMAGQDKGMLGTTKGLARELGVMSAVSFPGFVGGHEKARLLAGHDVFLNTNVVDNAPVTVIEAAASGLAVVTTDVGGLPDLLEDEISGLLVQPRRPDLIAAAVRRIVDEPGLLDHLAKGGRAVAERSAWPAVRDQWDELLSGLQHSRRAGVPG